MSSSVKVGFAARAVAAGGNVFLGGHSAGTGFTARYAATDFNLAGGAPEPGYLKLRGLILLMDVRHPLQPFDQQMLDWALAATMPVHILLTKADKLKKGPATSTLLKVRAQLEAHRDLVSVQLFSALKHSGHEQLLAVLNSWLTDTGPVEVMEAKN